MRCLFLMGCVMLWSSGISNADTMVRDTPNNKNVFIITLDGYRWQELFSGADSTILSDQRYTQNVWAREEFWHNDERVRRKKLMPFVWSVLEKEGQIFGNRKLESRVNTKNVYGLSYPGYNEMFTGAADPFIWSNKKLENSNENLLEYLNAIPEYNGKIAAFTSWDVFPQILASTRTGVYVNSGTEEKITETPTPKMYAAVHKMRSAKADEEKLERKDSGTFALAKNYIQNKHPKVLFIGFGGTDSYGHNKDYHLYLRAAHDADAFIKELWEFCQSDPFYKDNTTFVITTDHGRGDTPSSWHKHGAFVSGSSQTWLMLLGNNIKALGQKVGKGQLYQTQLAGTIARLLGVHSFSPQTLPPVYLMAKK